MIIGLAALAAIGVGIMFINLQPALFAREYKPKIANRIAMVRTYLNQQLQPLGIGFSQPSPTQCSWEPDPALRSFYCDSTAHVTHANSPQSADAIFQELASLDKSLKAAGWKVYANDYRTQNFQ